jgi:predicted dienelactone hydrolase
MAVGCRAVDVHDHVEDARVAVHVLYASDAAPAPIAFGAYAIDAASDGAVAGDALPVIAISHGTGGTPWGYRGLAEQLAGAGFAVAMIEHTGNSRNGDALAGTPANLANRPRHVRLALDAIARDPLLAPHVHVDRAAVIGHSMGGYTALAIAGGQPLALPHEAPDGIARAVPVDPDPRVRAVVLLAPALPWLMAPGALATVHARVLARTGERDELAPPYFVETVLAGLPASAALDYAVVSGAGHFAWFWPVPDVLARAGLPPAKDPPGFDRAGYQRHLRDEVTAFLRGAI